MSMSSGWLPTLWKLTKFSVHPCPVLKNSKYQKPLTSTNRATPHPSKRVNLSINFIYTEPETSLLVLSPSSHSLCLSPSTLPLSSLWLPLSNILIMVCCLVPTAYLTMDKNTKLLSSVHTTNLLIQLSLQEILATSPNVPFQQVCSYSLSRESHEVSPKST